MPGFKVVNETHKINLNNEWVQSKKFSSKDRFVDEKGYKVGSDYEGRQYKIIEKKERTFSGLERLGRGLLGTVAVICTLFLGLFSKSVRNLFIKSKKNIRLAILQPNGKLPLQKSSATHLTDNRNVKNVEGIAVPSSIIEKFDFKTANFSDFENTGKVVNGTGSGECSIYKSKNGIEYIMKKNKVFEFYAGTLFQLFLGEHSAKVLFAKSDPDFYVGSQFEPSYREIWLYHYENKKIPENDLEGLSLIIAASFLLGEIDLKGLNSANSNVGLKTFNNTDIYFKIDHEQTFVFGGKYWREGYIIDENWREKLRNYADQLKFNLVSNELLEKAVQQIISIPLKAVENACDFCEDQLKDYPNLLKEQIDSSSEELFFGLPEATTIKEAVLARFQALQQHAHR